MNDVVTSFQKAVQTMTPQAISIHADWRDRGDGELETHVNGFHLVVFRAADFSGWNCAVNGRVLRGAHFRLVWPQREHAQGALLLAAQNMGQPNG